jgi:hypothetical protein
MSETVPMPIPVHRYRIMFADGAIVDFLATRDGSELRDFALAHHYDTDPPYGKGAHTIVGVADLGLVFTYEPRPSEP